MSRRARWLRRSRIFHSDLVDLRPDGRWSANELAWDVVTRKALTKPINPSVISHQMVAWGYQQLRLHRSRRRPQVPAEVPAAFAYMTNTGRALAHNRCWDRVGPATRTSGSWPRVT